MEENAQNLEKQTFQFIQDQEHTATSEAPPEGQPDILAMLDTGIMEDLEPEAVREIAGEALGDPDELFTEEDDDEEEGIKARENEHLSDPKYEEEDYKDTAQLVAYAYDLFSSKACSIYARNNNYQHYQLAKEDYKRLENLFFKYFKKTGTKMSSGTLLLTGIAVLSSAKATKAIQDRIKSNKAGQARSQDEKPTPTPASQRDFAQISIPFPEEDNVSVFTEEEGKPFEHELDRKYFNIANDGFYQFGSQQRTYMTKTERRTNPDNKVSKYVKHLVEVNNMSNDEIQVHLKQHFG